MPIVGLKHGPYNLSTSITANRASAHESAPAAPDVAGFVVSPLVKRTTDMKRNVVKIWVKKIYQCLWLSLIQTVPPAFGQSKGNVLSRRPLL